MLRSRLWTLLPHENPFWARATREGTEMVQQSYVLENLGRKESVLLTRLYKRNIFYQTMCLGFLLLLLLKNMVTVTNENLSDCVWQSNVGLPAQWKIRFENRIAGKPESLHGSDHFSHILFACIILDSGRGKTCTKFKEQHSPGAAGWID